MSSLKEINFRGRTFSVLDLPDTDIFKLEITCQVGANLERVYKKLYNTNVYGGCHLIEHLGFKTTRDYTSEELLNALKNNGSYNANTGFERINYYYFTSSENADLAIDLITNVAFNDFSKISEAEFLKEKDVVVNEVKRYNDDKQNMFWMDLQRHLLNLEQHDNVLGSSETVSNLSFDDLKKMKSLMLTELNHVYTVVYDSKVFDIELLLANINDAIDSFQLSKEIDLKIENKYDHECSLSYTKDNQEVKTETDQTMIAYVYEEFSSPYVLRTISSYISSLAPDVSLNDYIREKNGLTYGISLWVPEQDGKFPLMFGCDVTKGNEELLMQLYKQSINDIYETFTEETYSTYMKKRRLNLSMDLLDKKTLIGYSKQMYTAKRFWHEVSDYFEDADKAPYKILEAVTFETMKNTLKKLKELTETDSFVVIKGNSDVI